MYWFYCLPGVVFILLLLGEKLLPSHQQSGSYHRLDWVLNLIGLFVQGIVIPLLGILLAYTILPSISLLKKGALPVNWWGAFLINFIFIDFLYYWQHRLFHRIPFLWRLHESHHSSPRVDIWATSRNNLWVNFLFVYIIINPIMGYLCQNSDGFFAGAMVTASLDIFRHSNMNFNQSPSKGLLNKLATVFVMPWMHHNHHNMLKKPNNFGANLIIWDKLFNTFDKNCSQNIQYQPSALNSFAQQFYYPFVR